MSGDLCNNFQMLAAWLVGVHPATMFSCQPPAPPIKQEAQIAMPADLPVHMRGLGLTVPTENVLTCEGEALKWGKVLLPTNSSRSASCVTSEGTALSDFQVEKSCPPEAAKDSPQCTTRIVRPAAKGLKAGG